ncbi:hypothetical protein DHEL01_v209331 [Diaporthe helianthi]|uniref:Uncharacterized protein n=1 Tax=Diaporthe helianthi TaxID=158607 RepID=A0A2P5HPS9_DIAHE|nr:hypothetical protein DHEL01_v209331 [Diaporthe helianthi]
MMDDSQDNSNVDDQVGPSEPHDHAIRHAVQRAGERTQAAQRAAVARGLLPFTRDPEGVVARSYANGASTSPSPTLRSSADARGGQLRGNPLNVATGEARPATTPRSTQAPGLGAISNDGWASMSFVREARARARARATAAQATRDGQTLRDAVIVDGPLPSAGVAAAAPAVGTMPAVGRTASITVQCHSEHHTVNIDLSNAAPLTTYNISIIIPPCPPRLPSSPRPSPPYTRQG